MAYEWYYLDGENERGPLTPEDMSALVATGTISAETRVWRDGWDDWKPAGSFNLDFTAGKPPRPRPKTGQVDDVPPSPSRDENVTNARPSRLTPVVPDPSLGNSQPPKKKEHLMADEMRFFSVVAAIALAVFVSWLAGQLAVFAFVPLLSLIGWWVCAFAFRNKQTGPRWAIKLSQWTFTNIKWAEYGAAWLGVVAVGSLLVCIVNIAQQASAQSNAAQLAAEAHEKEVQEQASRLAQERAEAEARAQAEARANVLRTKAAENAGRYRDEMQPIVKLIQARKLDEAGERVQPLVEEATEYTKLDPVPAEIQPLLPQVMGLAQRINRLSAVSTAVHDLSALKGQAKELAQSQNNAKDWSMIVDIVAKALRQVEVLENADAEARQLIPSGLNLRQERASLERQRDTYRERMHKAEAAEAADRKAAEDAAAICGPQPRRSEWDGEVSAVTYFVKESAHDPSSIEVKDCSVPVLTTQDCWVTTCAVRGKNVLGAMVLERVEFSIASGGVRRR